MSRLTVHHTTIEGLHIVERKPLGDDRGFLERLYCQETLGEPLKHKGIRQINHTLTRKTGTVRGLHFQYPPHAETKIVTCVKGKVWDVAVDLRKHSPTFLQYHAVTLSEDNFQSLLIPEGFAHGFQTLAPDCELLYFHTADYCSSAEGALNAIDPYLAIPWPLPIVERSERDSNHTMLTDTFLGVEIL
ncbi:dTDP-4-dehydrorhamnose 3,5-epimerase family protein [Chrysiogenes arsenatis]|uniref:dTDP-4-dehydrorhamnose 3,5-epimerase family protein n=1 Tax=Chrysiogenes arsenatis TaxID=309797 RepID=UPI0004143777|nr:dTDP-4-dehydrorhamnose 3,5-epimerase family protein [Chrysiogenes arsenatis]